MPIPCPKCNTLNPQGAEICGECGWTLVSSDRAPSAHQASSPEKKVLLPDVVAKGKNEKAPIPVQILSDLLWILGASLLALSLFLIKPTDSFMALIISLLPPRLSHTAFILPLLGAGLYTLIVAYGISNLKKWAIKVYISWVLLQVGLEILTRIYYHDLGMIYSAIVLGELLIIPLLWKIRQRFFY